MSFKIELGVRGCKLCIGKCMVAEEPLSPFHGGLPQKGGFEGVKPELNSREIFATRFGKTPPKWSLFAHPVLLGEFVPKTVPKPLRLKDQILTLRGLLRARALYLGGGEACN